jgi:hypothetical protein
MPRVRHALLIANLHRFDRGSDNFGKARIVTQIDLAPKWLETFF